MPPKPDAEATLPTSPLKEEKKEEKFDGLNETGIADTEATAKANASTTSLPPGSALPPKPDAEATSPTSPLKEEKKEEQFDGLNESKKMDDFADPAKAAELSGGLKGFRKRSKGSKDVTADDFDDDDDDEVPEEYMSVEQALEEAKQHNDVDAYIQYERDANSLEEDDWTFGDPFGDQLEDMRSFNSYLIERRQRPIPFYHRGQVEGKLFFENDVNPEGLLKECRDHPSFQEHLELCNFEHNFGSPLKDAIIHINLFNKWLQELHPKERLVTGTDPRYSIEIPGADDNLGSTDARPSEVRKVLIHDPEDDDNPDDVDLYSMPPTENHPRLHCLLKSAAKAGTSRFTDDDTILI